MLRIKALETPVRVAAMLCALVLLLEPALAVSEPRLVTKVESDGAGLIPLSDSTGVVPGGMTALAESEPNDVPSLADPISSALGHGGSIDAVSDMDDIYSIALNPGDVLEVRLQHDWSADDEFADVDLYLYPPQTDDDFSLEPVDTSQNCGINFEYMRYTVPATDGGIYYLDAVAWDTSNAVAYLLDVSVNDSVGISGVTRLYGESRYDTAVEVSARTFPRDGCDTVVIATGADFPDALAATSLAGLYRGPLLLTPPTSVPVAVLDELDRLGAENVVIVGGTRAVGDSVKSTLVSKGYAVRRISGRTRYETAALVAHEILSARPSWHVFVVRGDGYPDALAAGPYSYYSGWPILLTPTASLDKSAASVIDSHNISYAFVVGGTAAVSTATELEIEAMNRYEKPTIAWRVAGANRYDTAAQLALEMEGQFSVGSFRKVGIATGRNFPDALAGGAALGYGGGVLLLTPPDVLDPAAESLMSRLMWAGDDVVVFGGESVIEDAGALSDVWLTLADLRHLP